MTPETRHGGSGVECQPGSGLGEAGRLHRGRHRGVALVHELAAKPAASAYFMPKPREFMKSL